MEDSVAVTDADGVMLTDVVRVCEVVGVVEGRVNVNDKLKLSVSEMVREGLCDCEREDAALAVHDGEGEGALAVRLVLVVPVPVSVVQVGDREREGVALKVGEDPLMLGVRVADVWLRVNVGDGEPPRVAVAVGVLLGGVPLWDLLCIGVGVVVADTEGELVAEGVLWVKVKEKVRDGVAVVV